MSISNNYLSKAVFIVFSNNHPYCTGQTDTPLIVGGGDGWWCWVAVMGVGDGWWLCVVVMGGGFKLNISNTQS